MSDNSDHHDLHDSLDAMEQERARVSTLWVIVTREFASAESAEHAIETLGDHLGGLQCRSAAGKSPVRPGNAGTFIGAIEVIPEVASFAFGFFAGWRECETAS